MEKSPYLARKRLADVIAAIQAMGTYKYYKLPFEKWAERITGVEGAGDYWMNLFIQHPEFFRLDGNREKASLVWRRQYPRRYHTILEKKLTQLECEALGETERREKISRVPLTSDDIQALIATAIDMHSRALEEEKEKRWWIPLLISGGGGLVGALIGVFFGK